MPKKIVILIQIIVLYAFIITGCNKQEKLGSVKKSDDSNKYQTTSNDILGNSFGNIGNMGFVAQQGNWIYFSNDSDGNKLYKIDKYGTNKLKINDDKCFNINIVGDYIYYSNGLEKGSIFRTRTDGTNRTKLNEDISDFICVVGDWIYYSNSSDKGTLYRIKTDGTGRAKINNDKSSRYINVIGEWIYYSNGSMNGKLYKIKTDGTNNTKLNDITTCYINYDNGWIYYIGLSELNPQTSSFIYGTKLDGTETKIMLNEKCYRLNVSNGWLFYSSYNDHKGLYKIKSDGTSRTKLVDSSVGAICLTDDWIYYLNEQKNYESSKISINGNLDPKTDNVSKQYAVTLDSVSNYETVVCRIIVNGKQQIALTGKTKAINYAKERYSGHILIQAVDGTNLEEFDINSVPNNIIKSDLPAIFVENNQIRIRDRLRVSGKASTFEGEVQARLKDSQGNIIIETYTTAHMESVDKHGPFTIDVAIDRSKVKTNKGSLELYTTSPKDGTEVSKIEVPVIFD